MPVVAPASKTIWPCSTLTAIIKYMPAILSLDCCWRLEPYVGKLACTVLRGRGAGDSLLLPGAHKGNETKTPYYIQLSGGEPIGFAGLYDVWRDELLSCTILTTTPNELMATLHDRMPVILSPEDYDTWLDPGITDPEEVQGFMRPYSGEMKAYPVSRAVNSPKNNSAALLQPV